MAGAPRAGDLPRDARVELVRLGISESIAPFDLHVDDDQDVRAEIVAVDLGMVRIVCASGTDIVGEVVRTPRLIRRSDPDFCKIDLQLSGRTVLDQDGSQAELPAGTFTFVDLSRPCQLAGGLNGVVAVMFPRSLLPLRYRDTRQLAGVTFQAPDASSALVAGLVGQVVGRLEDYSGPAGQRVGTAIFDLITAALLERLDRATQITPDRRLRVLTWQVKTFIEDRLADPELTPGQIAAAHHISLRYLYKIFETQQTSVGSWIRSRRLEHCHRDLADPALRGQPVSTIGGRWGLVDATHFARVFKAQYGVTPSEYRRLCTPV